MRIKRILVLTVLVLALAVTPVFASALSDGNVPLGADHVKMTWYLVGYGKHAATGTPIAVVRKYYTNTGIKNETVELIMSKFGIAPDRAASLYYTQYDYIYSKDLKTFAVASISHENMAGEVIFNTVYDDSADDKLQTWVAVQPKGPSGLALAQIRKIEKF